MESRPYDIVLLPSDELAQKAIAASKDLEKFGSLFTLEAGKCFPHMSLYMFQQTDDSLHLIEEALRPIAQKFRIVQAVAKTYSLGQGFGVGYIDPEYETTAELRALQVAVIEAINPLRSGARESDLAKMKDAEGIKLENLQKYGYPAAGELFRPHITLSRLQEHQPEALDSLPDIHEFDGMFTRLGLFEMGPNGTCVRKVLELQLV